MKKLTTTIEEATITGMELRTITMGNSQQRSQLLVECKHNTPNGVMTHGFEVWGQDKIEDLNLQKGKMYTISCTMIGRLYGGRYSYTLQAYAAKECASVEPKNEGVRSAF